MRIGGWASGPGPDYSPAALIDDPKEIGALFDRYGPMVYRRARRLLGSHEDAEEATQEVFIRALKAGDGFERKSKVSTWLYRITVNYCLNKLRDRDRRRELWSTHVSPTGEESNTVKPANERMILMRRLLAEADEQMARAALHVHVDGMSHAEAAELLGVSRRTVGNLLTRFNEWAKSRIEEEQEPRG